MEKHNFVNIQTLNREELLHLLEMAKEFEAHPNRELLKGMHHKGGEPQKPQGKKK